MSKAYDDAREQRRPAQEEQARKAAAEAARRERQRIARKAAEIAKGGKS